MDVRTRIALLAAAAGVGLAVGIPVLWLTSRPESETADGTIVWIHLAERRLLLHALAGADNLRDHDVQVYLPEGRGLAVEPGHRPVTVLRAGQHVRVQLGRRSHWAHQILVED